VIDLRDRVALVTGGSRGLGAEIVRELAQAGADVAFTYRNDEAAAQALAREITALSRRSLSTRADASDFGAAERFVAEVAKELGRFDILVCNAGVANAMALQNVTEQAWDSAIDVSLKGAFNYIRAAAPIYMGQDSGKIVCIGSINGLRGRIGSIAYNSAKAGLVGLVKTAAAELGRHNVNVNVVAPGFIETPSQSQTPELIRDLVLKECAIRRLGTPADVAPVVVFLCSDAARHVTGQVIKVDAGQYL
jgi:3-oxoacyl-[acyl-carrier protein] reductase